MKRQDLINCIEKAYKEARLEEANEDNFGTPDYIEDFDPYTDNLLLTVEEQYATEFGWMVAREGLELLESEYDEYLEQILYDCDSGCKLEDLS